MSRAIVPMPKLGAIAGYMLFSSACYYSNHSWSTLIKMRQSLMHELRTIKKSLQLVDSSLFLLVAQTLFN
jgi:hypothetical protein